jgi:hypothetical protein
MELASHVQPQPLSRPIIIHLVFLNAEMVNGLFRGSQIIAVGVASSWTRLIVSVLIFALGVNIPKVFINVKYARALYRLIERNASPLALKLTFYKEESTAGEFVLEANTRMQITNARSAQLHRRTLQVMDPAVYRAAKVWKSLLKFLTGLNAWPVVPKGSFAHPTVLFAQEPGINFSKTNLMRLIMTFGTITNFKPFGAPLQESKMRQLLILAMFTRMIASKTNT